MHIRVIAVGTRQPAWVGEACSRYAERLPRGWRFELHEIDQGQRARATPAAQAERLLKFVRAGDFLVALDERGRQLRSVEFAAELESWTRAGHDVVFVIGGADGLDEAVLGRANFKLSLSAFTLAHGVARAVLLEQVYRAHTLMSGHPYHRE